MPRVYIPSWTVVAPSFLMSSAMSNGSLAESSLGGWFVTYAAVSPCVPVW